MVSLKNNPALKHIKLQLRDREKDRIEADRRIRDAISSQLAY